jgi:hypothetical protein
MIILVLQIVNKRNKLIKIIRLHKIIILNKIKVLKIVLQVHKG